ncbi:hypothetical protein Tco_0219705, partial [Tanacetum coccineum]
MKLSLICGTTGSSVVIQLGMIMAKENVDERRQGNVLSQLKRTMLLHNATFQSDLHPDTQEEQAPNSFAKQYYEMLEADNEPLYEGCQKFSTLEVATRLLNWKAECNVPEATYNQALSLFKDMLHDGNQL